MKQVAWSAGKDSTVLLDLARRAFPDIPAVFVDTGLEYPEIREFAKTVPNVIWLRPELPFTKVIEQYGFPVISKDVAKRVYYARKGSKWAIRHMNGYNTDGSPSWYCQRYMKWRFLLEAPFSISDRCCDVMKKRPFHKYIRETGNMPILGTMACESKRREGTYLIKKAEIDAKKAAIHAEDIANGVFIHVKDLPRREPRKSSNPEPTYAPVSAR